MTASPYGPAARRRRTVRTTVRTTARTAVRIAVRRFVLLALAAVLVPFVGAGAPAFAATGAAAVLAQSGGVAVLVPSGDVRAASAQLVREIEDFNRQEAEIAQQAKAVVAEAEQITKDAAALRNDTAAFEAKATAAKQKAGSFGTRAAALASRIDAHNNKPHTFQLPAQAAASSAYDAEASELRSEQAQLQAEKGSLESEQSQLGQEESKLGSRQSQLSAAAKAQEAKAKELQAKEQQLQPRAQQLLQQMAQATQSLADNPPDPAAAMDQGGDAAAPPQHRAQAPSQRQNQSENQGQSQSQSRRRGVDTVDTSDAAGTADSPYQQPRTSALKAYAKQAGTTVDMRPGTAYLLPEAVGQLPAAQAAQLGSPSIAYDGLVRKPDGNYTALQVQMPGAAAAPALEVFKTAMNRRGKLVAYKAGVKLVIDEIKTVQPAPEPPDTGPGSPSPSPSGKAACLTQPRGRPSGSGWILNTEQSVPSRNRTAGPSPSGTRAPAPATRAGKAEACLTNPLVKGDEAAGDITGWEDANAQSPGGGLARCHLIANVLGGRGSHKEDWINLVPCYQLGLNIKGISMRMFEARVQKEVNALSADGNAAVYYVVTPLYRDDSSTIPWGASMSATVQLPDGTSLPVFNEQTLLNIPENGGPGLGN
ncbi:DNA/RNA non-specific endonuclease [Kitasatospora sp. NPDC059811]|uniref:DNA/RNA non-specific endonuclease n=1 Tax=Streptomycetaceae TaxID=2062 RepID=UPI000A62FB52|nr:DNA/RNA non-specific endonuclease [Streptomyces sp. MJM8645]